MKSGSCTLLVAGLLLAGCGSVERRTAGPPEVLASFPFDPNARWILVPVTLEGRQYPFILDTGCTSTIFDTSLKDWLGKRFLWPKKGKAADGKSFTLEFFHAPEAFVGPLKINDNSLVCAADVSGVGSQAPIRVHGLLGMDFLKDYIVQLDGDRASVSFLRGHNGAEYPEWGDAVYIRNKAFSAMPYVEGHVDGVRATFLVDTGAVGVMSGRLERRVFERVQSGSPGLTYRSRGSTMAQAAVSRTGSIALPDRLCLGSLTYDDTAFIEGRRSVLDLPFFSGHVVTFDFPNDRLYLKPAQNRQPWGGRGFGVGNLGFALHRRHGGLSVSGVTDDSLAYREDIREGDVLLEVDGQDVSGLTPIELLKYLVRRGQGRVGDDELKLTFGRAGTVHRVSFARDDLRPKPREVN